MEKLDRKRGNRYLSRRSSAKGFPDLAFSDYPVPVLLSQRRDFLYLLFPGRYFFGLPRPRRSVGSGDAASHSRTCARSNLTIFPPAAPPMTGRMGGRPAKPRYIASVTDLSEIFSSAASSALLRRGSKSSSAADMRNSHSFRNCGRNMAPPGLVGLPSPSLISCNLRRYVLQVGPAKPVIAS